MTFEQIGQDCPGQGRSLAWVSTRTQFIKKHQCTQALAFRCANQRLRETSADIWRIPSNLLINLAQDLYNPAQVGRKSTQTLLDTLFIANIGKDLFKDSNLRMCVGGNM